MTQLVNNIQIILDALSTTQTRIRAERAEHGPVPGMARTYVSAVDRAASTVATIVRDAYDKGVKIVANDLVYPEGRARQLRQLLADAENKSAAAVRQADGNTTLARAVLLAAAMPAAPTGTSATHARTDALMLLNGKSDAIDMMNQLAHRNDNVGALVVSPWGRDYLTSIGIDGRNAEVVFDGIQGHALTAALKSGDTERERAAAHALNINGLHQVRDAAHHAADATLGYMRTEWSVAHEGKNDPNAPAAPSVLDEEEASFSF